MGHCPLHNSLLCWQTYYKTLCPMWTSLPSDLLAQHPQLGSLSLYEPCIVPLLWLVPNDLLWIMHASSHPRRVQGLTAFSGNPNPARTFNSPATRWATGTILVFLWLERGCQWIHLRSLTVTMRSTLEEKARVRDRGTSLPRSTKASQGSGEELGLKDEQELAGRRWGEWGRGCEGPGRMT